MNPKIYSIIPKNRYSNTELNKTVAISSLVLVLIITIIIMLATGDLIDDGVIIIGIFLAFICFTVPLAIVAAKTSGMAPKFYQYILKEGNSYTIFFNKTTANAAAATASLASGVGGAIGGAAAIAGVTLLSDQGSKDTLDATNIEMQNQLLEIIRTNGGIPGLETIHYENVKFLKENKKQLFFQGDLIDKKGQRKSNKKFVIGKIYANYEELKTI